MPSIARPDRLLGAAVGALAALFGLGLGGTVLLLVGNGPLGSLDPFTELTADGVGAFTALTWTYFDTLGAPPVVTWSTETTASVVVQRGVIAVLLRDGGTAALALWLATAALLTVAGGLAVLLSRRLADSETVPPHAGSYVALGYVPVLLLALWVATVPVAPDATGVVTIGGTTTDAATLEGVTAGPTPMVAVLAAVGYPLGFGLLGGLLVSRFDSGEA